MQKWNRKRRRAVGEWNREDSGGRNFTYETREAKGLISLYCKLQSYSSHSKTQDPTYHALLIMWGITLFLRRNDDCNMKTP